MNKLILFCLFSAALVAISYAEDTKEEGSLLEVAAGSRVVREAGRQGRKGRRGGKRGKGRKGRKGRKGGKKARKTRRKGGKRGGMKKKNAKNNKRNNRSCMAEACLANAVDAVDLLGTKMTYFNKQSKRITAFQKQMKNKAGKKDLFAPLLSALREAGGGNASALLCNGETGAGADTLTSLSDDISKCADNIESSCTMELSAADEEKIANCTAKCEDFTELANAAMEAEGADACTLWEAEELAEASAAANSPDCKIVTINDEVKAAKKACTTAFGACRKLEDEVSSALSACSPANSPDALKAAAAQGAANLAAADKVSAKIDATLAARSFARSETSCSGFAVEVVSVSGDMAAAPLLAGIGDMLEALLALTVAPCSDDEKAALTEAGSGLDSAKDAVTSAIEAKMEDLMAATGSTVSLEGLTVPAVEDTTMAE